MKILVRPCRYAVGQSFGSGNQLLKTRQRVSNIIAYTSDMGDTYINIVTTGTKYNKRTKAMVGATSRALVPDVHHGPVDFLAGLERTPCMDSYYYCK